MKFFIWLIGPTAMIGALVLSAFLSSTVYADEKAKEPVAPTAALVEPASPGPFLTDHKLKELLKLTDAQWTRIEAILVEKEVRNRGELDRHLAAQRVINSQSDAKLAEVLSAEQMTAYFATERKGNSDRLNTIAAEIKKRREKRQQDVDSPEKK